MLKLAPPDSHHLEAAEGWLELGAHLEADAELDKIAPRLRDHPDVLELRWQIYALDNRWPACVDIAQAIIQAAPNRALGWIHQSFALHCLKRTQEAYHHLMPVAVRFPKDWTIHYNLACYCAQLGHLQEAQEWFQQAMQINPRQTQAGAVDDPDLKPLWDSMSNTIWKKLK